MGDAAAAQEERFSRRKHDACFTSGDRLRRLDEAGIALDRVDHVVFYDKPFLKFERLLETYLAFAARLPVVPHGDSALAPRQFFSRVYCKEMGGLSSGVDWDARLLPSEHRACGQRALLAVRRGGGAHADGVG
jgi:carbamoyltransferase